MKAQTKRQIEILVSGLTGAALLRIAFLITEKDRILEDGQLNPLLLVGGILMFSTGFLLAFGSIWKLWKMATSGETK
jgi:hypothetical protein